ncbi:MAG: hypothetical protein JNN30_00320 [Rhodanobacteraceae bacterium]|nr:hypothetical protein [Rhodanobacteraceae bacterium]
MFRPIPTTVSTFVLTLASLTGMPAMAVEVCDLYPAGAEICEGDSCYQYVTAVINSECDLTGTVVTSEAEIAEPPPSPRMKCARDGNSYRCEAWPQSDELNYSWSGQNNTPATAPAASPIYSFACSAGTVSVSITTSVGAASVASVTIPACN